MWKDIDWHIIDIEYSILLEYSQILLFCFVKKEQLVIDSGDLFTCFFKGYFSGTGVRIGLSHWGFISLSDGAGGGNCIIIAWVLQHKLCT